MYDARCEQLAKHFLDNIDDRYAGETIEEHDRRVRVLAQAIQDAIEACMEDLIAAKN